MHEISLLFRAVSGFQTLFIEINKSKKNKMKKY